MFVTVTEVFLALFFIIGALFVLFIIENCFIGLFCLAWFFILITLVAKYVTLAFESYHFFDKPDGKLKKHNRPIPFSGGASIAALVLFLSWLVYAIDDFFFLICGLDLKLWSIIFVLPMILAFPVGFYDDIVRISPGKKFLSQSIFSFVAVCVTSTRNSLFESIISFVFVLSLVNAVNLIDVADGLCLSLSIVSTIGLMFLSPPSNLLFILIIFLLALLPVFWLNKPKAEIYLGNSGSGFLASVFSMIILKFFPFSSLKTFLTITTIFGVFFAELVALIVIRMYLGLKPYQGSPHHIASFLQSAGWSRWRIVVFASCVGMLLNILACLLYFQTIGLFTYILTTLLALVLWASVIYWPAQK